MHSRNCQRALQKANRFSLILGCGNLSHTSALKTEDGLFKIVSRGNQIVCHLKCRKAVDQLTPEKKPYDTAQTISPAELDTVVQQNAITPDMSSNNIITL